MSALSEADVLAEGCKTVAYSYIGTELTWPIYWDGALGKAKMDLDRAAAALNEKLSEINGTANVAVLKSVVTQASSAIPVMPLYIAMVFKKMREEGVHEGCMQQIYRMFTQRLYRKKMVLFLKSMRRIVYVWMIGNCVKIFSNIVVIYGRKLPLKT